MRHTRQISVLTWLHFKLFQRSDIDKWGVATPVPFLSTCLRQSEDRKSKWGHEDRQNLINTFSHSFWILNTRINRFHFVSVCVLFWWTYCGVIVRWRVSYRKNQFTVNIVNLLTGRSSSVNFWSALTLTVIVGLCFIFTLAKPSPMIWNGALRNVL